MNKQGLIEQVVSRSGQTAKEASAAVEAVFETIISELQRGEKVTVVGFGTFHVRQRAARDGRNPKTGAKIQIPARKVAVFTAGKDLKTAVG